MQADGPTVSVLSGGNIDPLLLQRVVAHGLAASGRYMTLRIPLPDRPGQLARVSELLAQAGANVIEVMHTRHGQGLQISEVILQLSASRRAARSTARTSIEDAARGAAFAPPSSRTDASGCRGIASTLAQRGPSASAATGRSRSRP